MLPFPLILLHIIATNAVKVVDFTPPPVPEGEAPTYIKKVITSRIGNDKLPIGIVL